MDLSEMLASWRAGKLRQAPPKALLGKLESAFKNKLERLLEYGPPATAKERGELNDLKREFREQWGRMRQEIIDGMDADIETQRRTANPPRSPELETAMGRKSAVYFPKWQRSYGAMIRDAEGFKDAGDRAGLELVKEHVGLVDNPGARSTLAEGVGEALDGFSTDAERKAGLEARSLEKEREKFELGTGMRRSGMIKHMSEPVGPPARTPSPIAGSPAPQR